MTALHVVLPDGIDAPDRPSGGNTYDRHICRRLSALGWSVHEHAVGGGWPRTDVESLRALDHAVQQIPDGALVLLDGLVASPAPEVLLPQARRLRLVVLVHMPLGHRPADQRAANVRRRERAILTAAAAVVTTSEWARRRLTELYSLAAERLHVAQPGVDAAALAPGTATGGALLCVAAVRFDKGHDVLLDALAEVSELSWNCVCVGSLDREPAFVDWLRRRSSHVGLNDRVDFPGPRTGHELDLSYAAADLMVLASRTETYGMVITEALARGLPVITAEVGGVTEALGHGAAGTRPGLLIPAEDPPALAAAIRAWLSDADLRARLRQAARERRVSLSGWSTTAAALTSVLAEVSR